ncbi:MAG: lamin tail domain-containing protein [Vicinamibacteria bacterium]
MNLKRSLSLSVIGRAALALGVAASLTAPAAASSDVVISQVYGGGGNSGATLTNDFVELFNRGAAPVDVTGWSVQYASSAGTSWQLTTLSGSIAPGQYYLVQEAAGAGGSVSLPTPDATGGIAMAASSGKVALVSASAALSGACPVTAGTPGLVDFVGFGAANCFEGGGATPTLTNPTAALRASNGCADTDSNAADFATGAPNPRNTAAPAFSCGGAPSNPAIVATAANPGSVGTGGVTLLTATVLPGANPVSTGLAVVADLTAIGGAASQPLLDDGANGDATAGDGVFSFTATVAPATPSGSLSLPVVATDAQSRSASSSIGLVVTGIAPPPLVVISQVYGGGGNSGAFYRNDFVELFNRGDALVSLDGWAVQYGSSTGTTWQVTPLTGTLAPGRHYLVQQAQGANLAAALLPAPDAIGTIGMSATGGKLALTSTATALSGACPLGVSGVVDFVGFGSTANCFEGSGRTPAPSNTTATLRNGAGCVDTDDNLADFGTGAPTPRNTSAAFTDCSAPPAPPVAIAAIQGAGSSSPFAGMSVTTRGIVTARRTNGFFLQTPDASVDGDPATSEGIFVFTSAAPPAAATAGNELLVSGSLQEFRPSADPGSPPVTEIVGPSVSLLSSGNTLPSAVELGPTDLDPSSSIENIERYEGMRVSLASLTVVGPTDGTVSEPNATSTSNGVFYGVVTGTPRPFREPGIQVPDPLPAGSPCCVPRFDANPERLRVDSDGQPGASRIDVAAGTQVDGLVGVLDYAFRTYTLLPDPSAPIVVSGNPGATPVPAPSAEQFSIAAFNMERFFDTTNDPLTGEPVLTAPAFETRLAKASLLFRDLLRTPDVIGVEEVENLATLQSVAARLNADSVAAGDPDPAYAAYLAEGNDVGGIDSGFLVKSARVEVVDVTQEGKDATYLTPAGATELLNDRPPLVLRARIACPLGPAFPVTVIVNHLRSLNGVDEVDGRVRAKRLAQAEFLADLIQARQDADPAEHIVSLGDYNAFQFNDGFVDVIGTVKGTPASPDEVVLASASAHPVEPNLADLADTLPAEQRYSYNFDGNAQSLDHVLVTQNLLPRLAGFHYGRVDSDFPEVYRNDATRPERLSDHDPLVAIFDFPPNTPPSADAGPDQSVVADATGQATVQLQGTAADADGDALVATWTGPFGTASGLQPSVTLSLGTHVLTLQVDDGRGGIAMDSMTVEVRDETAPAIASVTPSLTLLWPPNGRLVPITLAVDASDASGAATCSVTGVTSNEVIGGPEAGWRADWRITGELSLLLRAERRSRAGRVYTIEVSCTDAAGNTATGTTSVLVPHDQRDHHDGDGCERNEHGRARGRGDDRGHDDRDRR